MSPISIEQLQMASTQEHLSLGASVYALPEVIDPDHFKWKHFDSPYGPSLSISLRNKDGQLIGRSLVQPRIFIGEGGDKLRGGIITDFVISPKYRNPSAMIGMTIRMKSLPGYDLIAHTSNEKSELIYRDLFKFPVAFKLTAFGVPINITNLLKSRINLSWLIPIVAFPVNVFLKIFFKLGSFIFINLFKIRFDSSPNDEDAEAILINFKKHAGVHFERKVPFLKWRFTSAPLFRGPVKWLWRNNQCLGYVAFRSVSIGGISFLVIMDPVFLRPLAPFESIALKFLCANLGYFLGSDIVFTMLNIANNALKTLKGFPFAPIPDRYLPHSTPLYIHKKENNLDANGLSTTFFTLADLDYF